MQTRKLVKTSVLLLATILLAWYWWPDSNNPVELADESMKTDSPARPEPEPASQPQTNPELPESTADQSAVDPVETLTVAGQVRDQQTNDIGGMRVEISPRGVVSASSQALSTTTDLAGNFLIEAVPMGREYRLEVLAAGGYAGMLIERLPLSLTMAPVEIVLESVELATVEGMFVDAHFAPVADFEILVQNVGMAYPGRTIKSDSSGFFQLGQFPAGSLQLSAGGKESFRVTGIELEPDEYRNLEIVVDKGNYFLSGWVINEFDEPLAQARVVLTSDYVHQDYQSTSYRLVTTDNNGNFSFANISGMDHRILVDAVGYQSQSLQHQFQALSDNLTIRLPRR